MLTPAMTTMKRARGQRAAGDMGLILNHSCHGAMSIVMNMGEKEIMRIFYINTDIDSKRFLISTFFSIASFIVSPVC